MVNDQYVFFDSYKKKMKGRLYGVLREKEKNREWQKFLDSIIIEIMGLNPSSISYYSLIGKLQSLHFLSYEYFRKTIFECMNLVDDLEVPNEL